MSAFDFRKFLDDIDSKEELFQVPVEVDTFWPQGHGRGGADSGRRGAD